MFKKLITVIFILTAAFPAAAMRSDTSIIDIPTADVSAVRTFNINTRMFSQGGVLAYFDYGISNRFMLGASSTVEHLIGNNDETVKFLVPALQLKLRLYDGNDTLPALAVGFDNQGFLYDHDEKEYTQKARGFYTLMTKEILTPGFLFTGGGNVTAEGFEFYKLAAFTGATYNIKDIAALMFEWDNIRRVKESRLNAGLRIYLYQTFAVDFALRDFNHKAERILQLRYTLTI